MTTRLSNFNHKISAFKIWRIQTVLKYIFIMYVCITSVRMYRCITRQMICSLHNDSLPLPNTRTIAPWRNDHPDGTIVWKGAQYICFRPQLWSLIIVRIRTNSIKNCVVRTVPHSSDVFKHSLQTLFSCLYNTTYRCVGFIACLYLCH